MPLLHIVLNVTLCSKRSCQSSVPLSMWARHPPTEDTWALVPIHVRVFFIVTFFSMG